MSADEWLVAGRTKQGALGRVKEFPAHAGKLSARELIIPVSFKGKVNPEFIGRLVSDKVRSLEVWWDDNKLKVVLCADSTDIDAYCKAVYNAYGGIKTEPLESHYPEWWHENLARNYIDVSCEYGHYAVNLEGSMGDVLPQIAEFVLKTRQAWVQIVFQKRDMSNRMQKHQAELKRAKERLTAHSEFQDNYKMLLDHAKRERNVVVSVRAVYDTCKKDYGAGSKNGNASSPVLSFHTKTEFDRLAVSLYRGNTANKMIRIGREKKKKKKWCNLFPLRLIPYNNELDKSINNYCSLGWRGNLKERVSSSFLLLPLDEFSQLHKPLLPGPDHVNRTQVLPLPEPLTSRKGFNMGFRTNKHITALRYYEMFGRPVDSKEEDCVVISGDDLKTHVYMVAATMHGKSSNIFALSKHLEMANIYADMPRDKQVNHLQNDAEYGKYLGGLDGAETIANLDLGWKNALIYIDPKGDDTKKFIRMHEPYSFKKERVHYHDPDKTYFSMNPLELPPCADDRRREDIITVYIEHLDVLFKEWFGDTDAFVNLKRILHTVLLYLYQHKDNPTLAEIYCIIAGLYGDGKKYLPILFRTFGEPNETNREKLETIARKDKSAFDSALNRLQPFTENSYLIRTFCHDKSTISFDEMLQPGAHTVLRVVQDILPPKTAEMIMQVFVLKVWLAIQARADKTDPEDLTQVVLVLDEFQIVKDIGVLRTMLTQARSKGLCLVLAHQTPKHLDESLLSDIFTNCNFQMAGRIEGGDAARLANAWGPRYSERLKTLIPELPRYNWCAKVPATDGQEPPPPMQLLSHYEKESGEILKDNMAPEEYDDFVCSIKEKNLSGRGKYANLGTKSEYKWMVHLEHGRLFEQHEWVIMIAALKPQTQKNITAYFGGTAREDVAKICHKMVQDGLLEKINSDGSVSEKNGKYVVTSDAKSKYLTFHPRHIGRTKDFPPLVEEVVAWYVQNGFFVGMAQQSLQNMDLTDLVAYDYRTGEAISVEIESKPKISSHPEHINKNMIKWKQMGFDRVHVWSYSGTIMNTAKEMATLANEDKLIDKNQDEMLNLLSRVTVFLLKKGRKYLSDIIMEDGGPRPV